MWFSDELKANKVSSECGYVPVYPNPSLLPCIHCLLWTLVTCRPVLFHMYPIDPVYFYPEDTLCRTPVKWKQEAKSCEFMNCWRHSFSVSLLSLLLREKERENVL